MTKSFTVKDILRMEVAPALGCTEPSAIALGAAAAASLLDDEEIKAIEIWVDANIYKNSVAVSIPGTEGLCGLDVASALGVIGGDPNLKLEVLEPVDEEVIAHNGKYLLWGPLNKNFLVELDHGNFSFWGLCSVCLPGRWPPPVAPRRWRKIDIAACRFSYVEGIISYF